MASKNETNLTMTRGDTLAFAVEIEGLEGQDLDTVKFSCKTDPDDQAYVFQKTLEDGISKVEAGKYRVRVAPEDTEDAELGKYYYDLQIGLNSDIYTIMKGKLELTWEATRED